MIAEKEFTSNPMSDQITLTYTEVFQITTVLRKAMEDIQAHLQVCTYNLNEHPKLVHERSVARSKKVMEECRLTIVDLYNRLNKHEYGK